MGLAVDCWSAAIEAAEGCGCVVMVMMMIQGRFGTMGKEEGFPSVVVLLCPVVACGFSVRNLVIDLVEGHGSKREPSHRYLLRGKPTPQTKPKIKP